MRSFEAGLLVRIPFPYTDKNTRQHRPALVVSPGCVGENAALLWVVMVTSAANRAWSGDVLIDVGFAETGLPAPSTIRPAKIATIEARLADPVGRIHADLLAQVMARIRAHLAP